MRNFKALIEVEIEIDGGSKSAKGQIVWSKINCQVQDSEWETEPQGMAE